MAFFFGNMAPTLHDAAKSGQQQAVWMLLQRGANVNARDNFNRTALHWAAELGHEGVARLLIARGVDLEAKGRVGWTALHCAASDGRLVLVQLLLESGANIEAKEFEGQTALQWAAYHGHEAVVRLLLQKGADITVRGKSGWTALNYASVRGHLAAALLLTIATTSRGLTPQGPPLNLPQYNPFLQTQQFHQVMPHASSAMHMPNMGYNPQAYSQNTALGFGPTAPLANQLNMQNFIAYAGDYQLGVVTQDTTNQTYDYTDYASS